MDVDAVAFDLYGTLLDVASVGRAAAEVTDDPTALVSLWRQKQLEYTWLRSLMGRHADFWAVTGDALDWTLERLGLGLPDDARTRLLAAWLDVRCYPEVTGALDRLAPRRLAVLSNGTPDMLARCLAAVGLTRAIDPVVSVEEVGVYKPHPKVYALVGERTGVPSGRALFVSSNPWDAAGARAAGLRVAWVNRAGVPFERLGVEPDLIVPDLAALSEAVTGAP